MKLHYFNQDKPDSDDMHLDMAKTQGYVPIGCLLGGVVVMGEINEGHDPCVGCACPKEKCKGRTQA